MACVVRVHIVGASEAEQRESNGNWLRNDRLIAVATHAQLHGNVKNIKELNPRLLEEMEAFFHQYNRMQEKEFRALDRCGPKHAMKLIENGRRKWSARAKK
jgi:inorganic pyrophosphatase